VSGYASGCYGDFQWAGSAGYRADPGTFTLGGSLRRPLTESIALYSNASYEAKRANWGVGFGIEFSLGGARSCSSCCTTRACCSTTKVSHRHQAMIETQSPDQEILLVNVPPQGEFPEPDSSAGEFPLLLDEQPVIPISDPVDNRISSWTRRYKNWNTRSLLILTPADVERSLNADGLTNRTQDKIQSPFTKFSLQTNGGFGRTDGRRSD